MMTKFAKRIDRISEPQTLLMANLARELRNTGVDLVDLSLGEPDFPTPSYIVEAAYQAMKDGFTKYPPVAGIPDLKQAIVDKFKNDNDLIYSTDQIVVSTGAKQSLSNVVMALLEEGDEAIIPTPYWVTYEALVQLAKGKPVFVPCGIEDNFKISPEKLEAAITPQTRMFIFSSPCNPTGAVYSKEELKGLAEVFAKHPNVIIVSDEIYEYINYGVGHHSLASFEEIKDRVVVINGFSKGYSMTGWRLGYMAANKEIAKACAKYQSQITSGANIIAQKAAVTAMMRLDEVKAMTSEFRKRRDYFLKALDDIPGVQTAMPDGAFYAFADMSSFFGKKHEGKVISNADELTMYLLNVAHVTGVTGSAFGDDQCVRFSFAASMEELEEAVSRIEKALLALK